MHGMEHLHIFGTVLLHGLSPNTGFNNFKDPTSKFGQSLCFSTTLADRPIYHATMIKDGGEKETEDAIPMNHSPVWPPLDEDINDTTLWSVYVGLFEENSITNTRGTTIIC